MSRPQQTAPARTQMSPGGRCREGASESWHLPGCPPPESRWGIVCGRRNQPHKVHFPCSQSSKVNIKPNSFGVQAKRIETNNPSCGSTMLELTKLQLLLSRQPAMCIGQPKVRLRNKEAY